MAWPILDSIPSCEYGGEIYIGHHSGGPCMPFSYAFFSGGEPGQKKMTGCHVHAIHGIRSFYAAEPGRHSCCIDYSIPRIYLKEH